MKKPAPKTEEEQELEIVKAVAQAWHGHSGNTKPIDEYQNYRINFKTRPTRFKLEAMKNKLSSNSKDVIASSSGNWDFKQSLWDSYEIVTLAKKLEAGMVLDHPLDRSQDTSIRGAKHRKESRNSLRNLLHVGSSKRCDVKNPPDHIR